MCCSSACASVRASALGVARAARAGPPPTAACAGCSRAAAPPGRAGPARLSRGPWRWSSQAVACDAHALAHRAVDLPLAVGPQRQQPALDARCGSFVVGRHLQQRQQRQPAGFQRHLVAQRLALQLAVRGAAAAPPGRWTPGASIRGRRSWTAPGRASTSAPAAARRRGSARERRCCRPRPARPRRPCAGCPTSPVRPAASCGRPHSGADAREQHEQHHHQRQAQRRGARRHPAGARTAAAGPPACAPAPAPSAGPRPPPAATARCPATANTGSA